MLTDCIWQIKKLTTAVKDLAERAQADIGLDYAYLDDVSYADWQRYHDLLRSTSLLLTVQPRSL